MDTYYVKYTYVFQPWISTLYKRSHLILTRTLQGWSQGHPLIPSSKKWYFVQKKRSSWGLADKGPWMLGWEIAYFLFLFTGLLCRPGGPQEFPEGGKWSILCLGMITWMALGDNSWGQEAREKLFQQSKEEPVRVWDGTCREENSRYTSLFRLAIGGRNGHRGWGTGSQSQPQSFWRQNGRTQIRNKFVVGEEGVPRCHILNSWVVSREVV